MPTQDEITEIITSFMETASPQEIQELKILLRQRKGSPGLGSMNFSRIAERVAASIRQQMGLSEKLLQETAVTAVSRLIRIYAPDISEKDLDLLMKEMMPSLAGSPRPPLPPGMMQAMVDQFVDYSLNRMNPEDKAQLPENWTGKYWSAFPPAIRALISKLLHNEIDEELFRLAVNETIRRMDPEKKGQ